ncbi:hypothetical protein V6N13_124526 [Hibiscus sabdariffa]
MIGSDLDHVCARTVQLSQETHLPSFSLNKSMGEIALTVRSLWPSGSFLVMGSEMKDKGSSFNGDGRSKMGLGLKVFGWLNGLAAVMMFDDENGNVGVCSGLTW